ncbi:histidine phosphatase family protein [Leptospira wolffii]|uniref:Histidine phosphatase family protein n=1 Tax=Leptospira wolffii TaxID=409998 RepID=A0ABV5BTT1_9LEPT
MSVIHLIRHGQANSQGENYDMLTPKGKEQAFLLGKYMAENQDFPDRILTGSLRRHRETAESFLEGVKSADSGRSYSLSKLSIEDSDWNEFSAELWKSYAKYLATVRPEFADTLATFSKIRLKGGIRSAAIFFKLTEEILEFWKKGEYVPEGIETYSDFEYRIERAHDRYFLPSSSERTFIFTSGTPISLLLRKILKQDTNVFTWMPLIWNTSVSTFRWMRGGFLPVTLNALPHIPEKKSRTLY